MAKNVLIVQPNYEPSLKRQLDPAFDGDVASGEEVILYEEANVARALALMDVCEIDVVIAWHALARDGRKLVTADGGIEFCELLHHQKFGGKTMLAMPSSVNAVSARAAECGAMVMQLGTGFLEDLTSQIRKFKSPEKLLTVRLCRREDASWSYEISCEQADFTKIGSLALNNLQLDTLSQMSRLVGYLDDDSWYEEFAVLGASLRNMLSANSNFCDDIERGVDLVNGMDRVRLSFSLGAVSPQHFGAALEAVFLPKSYPDIPWMIRSPISRSVSLGGGPGTRMFSKSAGLSALVVEAAAHGHADGVTDKQGRVLKLKPLPRVAHECEIVERTLLERIRHVKRVGSDSGLTRRELFDALKQRDWDIIHFAGHSYADNSLAGHGSGYLFIGKPEAPEALRIEEVSSYFRRSTLVYLSSCQSSSSAFAFELAREGVPVVIGFRWKVSDPLAAVHSHMFYRYLFKEESIDSAFMHTRRALHKRFERSDRAWASSMLVFSVSG